MKRPKGRQCVGCTYIRYKWDKDYEQARAPPVPTLEPRCIKGHLFVQGQNNCQTYVRRPRETEAEKQVKYKRWFEEGMAGQTAAISIFWEDPMRVFEVASMLLAILVITLIMLAGKPT